MITPIPAILTIDLFRIDYRSSNLTTSFGCHHILTNWNFKFSGVRYPKIVLIIS